VYAQLIDDDKGHTMAHVSTAGFSGNTDTERAREAGKALAETAKKQQIEQAVFDRGGFVYKGRLEALADGAREGGLHV
jgi:large subunit ribosomal protein L18